MRVGIDIDNVISNFNEELLKEYLKHDKYSVCIENDIDIMIDDSKTMCENCRDNGVKALLMDTPYNKDSKDKSYECLINYVDIMFDDRPIVCFNILNNNIKSYLVKTRYNYKYNEFNIPVVEDWEEIYKTINNVIKK